MIIKDIAKLLKNKYSESIEYLEDANFIKVSANDWNDVALTIKNEDK